MEEGYTKLFRHLERHEPQADLQSRILQKVKTEIQRQARQKLWVFGLSTVISLGATLALGRYFYELFVQSGSYQYLSLLFSGDSTVYVYWKELSLSLLESVPIVSAISLLVVVAISVWLGANTFTNARRLTLATGV